MELLDTIKDLRVFDLGRRLEFTTPVHPAHTPFRMALMRRPRDVVRADGSSSSNELLSLSGHTGTHIDALCHFEREGHLHGGVDSQAAAVGGRGFRELGVDTIKPIVSRGVLLDVARALGEDPLAGGRPITAADLEATCRKQGTDVRSGDAVLIRTGWAEAHYGDPDYIGYTIGAPGPDSSAARWLAERGVHVTGSDTITYEVLTPEQPTLPVHVILLVENGIHIMEVLDLDELGRAGHHEFVFVCSPLKMVGATGSPVRPLALVEGGR